MIQTKGNHNFKSEIQKNAIINIDNFFNLQEKIINLFRNYSFFLSESKYKAKHGEGHKTLTPKEML